MRLAGALACALSLAVSTQAAAQLEARAPALKSDKYAEMAAELESEGVMKSFAEEVNATIRLPARVGVRFVECGVVNAFYDPAERQISMCLELVEYFVHVMAEEYPKEEDALAAAEGASYLVLLHELGHALVDVLDLPITGREEDAVDQLAAWAMIDDEEGDEAVLDSALSYYKSAERAGGQVSLDQFADEHSLSLQRFFNLVCWVYGSNPEKYRGLVGEDMLPEARAQRCPSEYAQMDRSWSKLLSSAATP